jgi:hypothetical protein
LSPNKRNIVVLARCLATHKTAPTPFCLLRFVNGFPAAVFYYDTTEILLAGRFGVCFFYQWSYEINCAKFADLVTSRGQLICIRSALFVGQSHRSSDSASVHIITKMAFDQSEAANIHGADPVADKGSKRILQESQRNCGSRNCRKARNKRKSTTVTSIAH